MTVTRGPASQRDAGKGGDVSDERDSETVAHQAARFLAAHPEWDWRLADLAELVHLSVSQLGRAFNRDFGISPMHYLARVRAHKLARLLAESDLPIGVAMSQVGWRSRGHAARQFTAIMGISPSTYRREASERELTQGLCRGGGIDVDQLHSCPLPGPSQSNCSSR